jgi:voltage-gated potassium channel Kch
VERETTAKQFSHFLIGYNRTGLAILKSLQKLSPGILVVDFHPLVIRNLRKRGIHCVYGDAEDVELLEALKIAGAHMAVSTIPDFTANLTPDHNMRCALLQIY